MTWWLIHYSLFTFHVHNEGLVFRPAKQVVVGNGFKPFLVIAGLRLAQITFGWFGHWAKTSFLVQSARLNQPEELV
jgi:hypothetical protein